MVVCTSHWFKHNVDGYLTGKLAMMSLLEQDHIPTTLPVVLGLSHDSSCDSSLVSLDGNFLLTPFHSDLSRSWTHTISPVIA